MAEIQPINLNPGQLVVPKGDYSWLGNLVNTHQQTKANQAGLAAAERKEGALAELGKLDPNDPLYAEKAARIAMRMGEVSAASSMLNHAAELKLKREELEAKRSAPTLGGSTATPVAPSVPAQPPAATPPLTGPTPPLFTRTPNVSTSALPSSDIQPAVAQATPPIMAQAGAPGSNFTGFTTASGRPKVSYEGVSPELLQHANAVGNELYGTLNRPLGITSARDSQHTTGSQHYVGNALDLRTRDLSASQRQAIVASFRAKGLTAVDEGDHIHVAMPRGGAPVPGAPGAPGTVLASVQGRGPTSTGTGGAVVASAMPQTPLARTTVAALDPSLAPQMSMTDAGPQLPAGVSPAAPAAQGAAGPPILPSPTPLVPPNISLAALGALPAGGVGTIGPMGGPVADAMPPQGVQMAQAAQGAPGAYQLPWNLGAPQGAPTLPQQAPVRPVAPQQAPAAAVARGPVSGSPLEHIPKERLIAVATHRYASEGDKQLAIAELNRRAQVATEQNKTSPEYNNFLADKRSGAFPANGTFIEWQQAGKADTTLARNYAAVVAERKAQGLGPPEGGFEKFLRDNKSGVTVNTGDPAGKEREKAFITNMSKVSEAGREADTSKQLINTLRELKVETGWTAFAKAKLGELGLNTEGLTDIQTMESLVNFMVPSQPRAPGSQSEFEAKMIKSSLTRLINQPGSNAAIMNILESVADLNIRRAEIADRYMTSPVDANGKAEYSAADAHKDLQSLRKEGEDLGKAAVRASRGAPASTGTGGGWTKPKDVTDEDWAAAQKFLPKKGQ